MDEMTLLREFRADLPEPSDLTRQRARRALLEPPRRSGPPVLRRGVLVAAAAAVVGVVAVGGAVMDLRDDGNQPVRPVTALVQLEQTFPLRLTVVPTGLSGPHYGMDDGRHVAGYRNERDDDGISVAVSGARESAPAMSTSRATTVDGKPAELRVVDQPIQNVDWRHRTLSLVWQRRPGQWVTVTGHQGLADENVVRGVAANLVDEPQPVPLQLRVAPAGWALWSYKDDRILMFKDLNSEATLMVFLMAAFDPRRPEKLMDPGPTTSTKVDGRRAFLVRGPELVDVQVELPDGSAVVMYGPSDLITDDQMLRMAAGVRLTKG